MRSKSKSVEVVLLRAGDIGYEGEVLDWESDGISVEAGLEVSVDDGVVVVGWVEEVAVMPCAARALITASQPLSRVRMRSRSSSFSLSFWDCRSSKGATAAPPRRAWFSASSSATLRSRSDRYILRLSREFCAAILLR